MLNPLSAVSAGNLHLYLMICCCAMPVVCAAAYEWMQVAPRVTALSQPRLCCNTRGKSQYWVMQHHRHSQQPQLHHCRSCSTLCGTDGPASSSYGGTTGSCVASGRASNAYADISQLTCCASNKFSGVLPGGWLSRCGWPLAAQSLVGSVSLLSSFGSSRLGSNCMGAKVWP